MKGTRQVVTGLGHRGIRRGETIGGASCCQSVTNPCLVLVFDQDTKDERLT